MLTSDFDFDLPAELIAQHPMEPRDGSRLLVLHRRSGEIEHRTFRDLPEYLTAGDLLVRNNSRVVPARLIGTREATGGRWEGLFLNTDRPGYWRILATTRGKPRLGETVVVGDGLRLELAQRLEPGHWLVRVESDENANVLLERHGLVPLPPYIRKGLAGREDRIDYQTSYAKVDGSVAAPTAGLHFTASTFEALRGRSVDVAEVTLHVGIGTFRPIATPTITAHTLHSEWAEVPEATALAWQATRARAGRTVAVGTTSCRTLETAARAGAGQVIPWTGETQLYIQPGHRFLAVDGLVTNFHLPRSSLLVLVSALAGVKAIRTAYAQAIQRKYRFYSYGDAMLIID